MKKIIYSKTLRKFPYFLIFNFLSSWKCPNASLAGEFALVRTLVLQTVFFHYVDILS